jgi:hypothetical protein
MKKNFSQSRKRYKELRSRSSNTTTMAWSKRWYNFVDTALRLFLKEKAVKKVWRTIYRYNLWRIFGTGVGSLILAACIQHRAVAQIADDAETEIETIFSPHLTGAEDFVSVLFGSGRLLLFFIALALVAYGLYDALNSRGSNWYIWASIGGSLLIGIVLVAVVQTAIFGGGTAST